jgi:tRNA (cmo5U34)-methyltransferase
MKGPRGTAETAMAHKSSVDQIRARFDGDVERFSSLETGQSSTIDAPLSLELIAACTAAATPGATRVLDIGCGAGNYTLRLLSHLPDLNVTLLDLSRPMLDRAVERVTAATRREVTAIQGDIREVDLGESAFDVIVAAAVFHHLREDDEWEAVFAKCHRALAPGGSLWISDLVSHEDPAVQAVMWSRYGAYLEDLRGPGYRDHVFGYIEQEDTPRSLTYQIELLERVGFTQVDVLHKNACFAAFGGVKASAKGSTPKLRCRVQVVPNALG